MNRLMMVIICIFMFTGVVSAVNYESAKSYEERFEPSKALWWDYNWDYRRAITVDNSGNSDALTAYQVLVNLTYDGDMQNDFSDVRFTTGNSETELNYWIAEFNAGTDATIWVKVPNIAASTNTTIYVYYGNAAASTTSNYSSTMQKLIWEEAGGVIGGIWHFDEGSGTAVADGSSNGNDGILNGTGYSWDSGDGGFWGSGSQVFGSGSALSFNASDGYISINHAALNGADEVTTEFWVKTTGSTDGMVSAANSSVHNEYLIYNQAMFNPYIKHNNFNGSSPFNDDSWYHLAMTRDSSGNIECYLNATSVETGMLPAGPLVVDSGGLIIAQDQDNVGGGFETHQAFDGTMDELGIFARLLSVDEITCHYERRKYTDPEPTISVGSEEDQSVSIKSSSLGKIKAEYK